MTLITFPYAPLYLPCHLYLCNQVTSKNYHRTFRSILPHAIFPVSEILDTWKCGILFSKPLADSCCCSPPLKGCSLFQGSRFHISVHILLKLMLCGLMYRLPWMLFGKMWEIKKKVKWVHRFNQTCTQRVKETLTSVISELMGQRKKNC